MRKEGAYRDPRWRGASCEQGVVEGVSLGAQESVVPALRERVDCGGVLDDRSHCDTAAAAQPSHPLGAEAVRRRRLATQAEDGMGVNPADSEGSSS